MVDQLKTTLTILRRRQVQARTGLSRSSIYAKLDPKNLSFDPDFPASIRLSKTAVGWLTSEIDAWILSRPRSSH